MRASALIAILPHLQDPARASQARENALTAAAAIAWEEDRAKLLGRLAPYLDAEQLARALEVAIAIRADVFRAIATTSLAARLEGRARTRALRCRKQAVQNVFRVSAAIDDPEQRAQALAGAAHHMEGPARVRALDQALEATIAISSTWEMQRQLNNLASSLDNTQLDRALDAAIAASNVSVQGLIDLAPYLTPGQLDRALAAASGARRESERARALSSMARYLNPDQLQSTLDAVSHIADEGTRAIAQVRVSHYANAPVPSQIIDNALNSAGMTEDPYSRQFEFIALARRLDGPARIRALDGALQAAISISDQSGRARALRDVAPYLSPAQLDHAVAATAAIDDEVARGLALTGLARHLEEPALTAVIIKALDTARAIKADRGELKVELIALARELREPARRRILQGLMGTVAATQDEVSRGLELEELAPLLDTPQLSCALKVASAIRSEYTRDCTLASLAPHLDPAHLPDALAAATAPGADDEQARAQAIASVVPHMHSQARVTAIEEVLAAAGEARDEKARRKLITFQDERARARLVITVAPFLDAAQLDQALQIADCFHDDACLVSVLAALATYLEEPARPRAVEKAFHAVGRIEHARSWGWALADLVPHLHGRMRESTLEQALYAAPTVRDETARAELVITVAPFLDAAQLDQALQIADCFHDDACLASVLAALATYLEEPARSRALEKAIQAAAVVGEDRYLVWASGYLIPHLHGAVRSQTIQRMLDAAKGINHEESRVRALADVSTYLEGTTKIMCLDSALDTALSISDESYQARALEGLAPYLNITQLRRALAASTSLPYLGEYRPCEQIFRRVSFLASETAPSEIVSLTRQFYRELPPREALFAVTGAAVKALVHLGGSETATRLFESISR
jgi:hypothetical protein